MTRILVALTFFVAFFVGVPVMVRLCEDIGPQSVLALSVALAFSAAWLGHTPRSLEMAEDFTAALRDVGMSQKCAALTMGISEPVLSNWINGKEQFSASRMASLGPEFDVAFAKRRLARAQGKVAVIDTQALCDLVNAVQAMTAEYRKPRMVKAEMREGVA